MKSLMLVAIIMSFSSSLYAVCFGGYPNISVKKEIKEADFIIVGKVSSRKIVVDEKEDPKGYDAELFQIKVERILSGHPKKNVVDPYLTLFNSNDSGRFAMDVGETYLLFIYDGMDGRWVNSCGNSDTYKNSVKKIEAIKKIVSATHA